jgi:hypothetical protein
VNAIFPINEAVDAHLGQVSYRAQRSVAGARGRLFAALQDIYDAQALALSDDAGEQRLAQTMTDNALWYVGRILAAADTADAPYLQALKEVLAQWGSVRGGSQLDFLLAQGLLPPSVSAEDVADWRTHAGALYVEAFASPRSFFAKKGQRPIWSALAILERAGRARASLQSASATGYAEALRLKGLQRAEALIKQCHTYLSDIDGSQGTYDAITPFGPQDVTQVEAIVQALRDPTTAQLNQKLEETGVIARHRQLVSEGTGRDPDSSVIAVSDRRWLQQMSTYNGYGAEQSGEILALNVGRVGIFLAPEIAADMLQAGSVGGFSEIAAHELVHTTQPKQVEGRPLADQPHANAYPSLLKRHQHFEVQLLEGATQALTNHLRLQHDPTYDGELGEIYPTFTQMVDEAQAASGIEAETFYRELSAAPTHQRSAYLARALTGSDNEKVQRDLYETLLTINLRCECEAADGFSDELLARHRALTRQVFASASASAILAA